MPFDLIVGGHRFDPITLVCVRCGISRQRYDDTGQRCTGQLQPEAEEQSSIRSNDDDDPPDAA
jgi:hypothetical protein